MARETVDYDCTQLRSRAKPAVTLMLKYVEDEKRWCDQQNVTTDSIDWPDSSSSKCWRHSSSLAADCQRWGCSTISEMIRNDDDDDVPSGQASAGGAIISWRERERERTPRASRVTSKGKRDRCTDRLVHCDRLPLVNEQWNLQQSRSIVLLIDPRASSIKASGARVLLLIFHSLKHLFATEYASAWISTFLFFKDGSRTISRCCLFRSERH